MNENALRWKARIGSLKVLAVIVLVFAGAFFLIAIGDLSVATNNSTEPQAVDITQLARDEIATDKFVSVSGIAIYPAAYQETTDGKVTEEYYYLIDDAAGSAVLIKADGSVSVLETSEEKTISGLIHRPETKLRELIISDLPDIQSAGFETSADTYVGENERPPEAGSTTTLVIGLGVVCVLCIATFFFPGTVFGPKPLEVAPAPATGDAGVRATGEFQRLASVNPIQIGKGKRKFSQAVANIVPLENRRLMIYIHHVLTTKSYGVTVSRQESDWGAFVDSADVIDIEPGKLYGWKDRLAVRLRYRDEAQKEQMLLISFNHAAAQADFANQLRQMGFAVGSGEPSMM